MNRFVIKKKSFNAYVGANRVSPLKMFDISPQDFADHVRQANSWNDLGTRCGLEKNKFGHLRNNHKYSMMQQKVINMGLKTNHFIRQPITDDDFKMIVRESNYLTQVINKCKMSGNDKAKVLKRIDFLCIDTSHFKTRRARQIYNVHTKVDEIDEETFKMLVKNNTTWKYLSIACGYSNGGGQRYVAKRIEKLGLNIDHINDVISADKVFVVDSKHPHRGEIKKKLIRDFNRPYICAECKNEHFTTNCDGVLMWNNKEIHLELEHKNGINNDNRPENLEFLCPSCHSQTSTYKGKNNKKYRAGQEWLEDGKISHAPGSISSLLN